MTIIEAVQWGTACAIIGVVYAQVLANDDTPISGWFDFLERNSKRHPWITKVVGGCYLCTSGQLALWSSLIWFAIIPSIELHHIIIHPAPSCIVAACSAVIMAGVINKIYQWTQN